jgi:hypothetical protein
MVGVGGKEGRCNGRLLEAAAAARRRAVAAAGGVRGGGLERRRRIGPESPVGGARGSDTRDCRTLTWLWSHVRGSSSLVLKVRELYGTTV